MKRALRYGFSVVLILAVGLLAFSVLEPRNWRANVRLYLDVDAKAIVAGKESTREERWEPHLLESQFDPGGKKPIAWSKGRALKV